MSPLRCCLLIAAALASWSSAAAPLKVACVGDSITEGAGLSNPSLESYPARLQRLLGTNEFIVRNYGVSGRTLLKKGDFPYWKEVAYTQSRAWEPDVVTLKLGTNDSKPQNWRHSTNFVFDLEALIASYADLPSHPKVVLCTPAPVFRAGAFTINPGIVATNIAPTVREVATRLGLDVIDFHERLAGHGEWFPDTVHPNSRGMAVMAAVLHDYFRDVPEAIPSLQIAHATGTRAVLSWSASHAGWVLQWRNALSVSTPAWAVADQVPYTDGTTLRLTNSVAVARYFRLWKP